jgi:hypothetical protein
VLLDPPDVTVGDLIRVNRGRYVSIAERCRLHFIDVFVRILDSAQ